MEETQQFPCIDGLLKHEDFGRTHIHMVRFPKVAFKGPLHTINIWGEPEIGEGTQIGAYVEIGDDVIIGERCIIGAFTFIPPKLRIGNDVWIGPRVTFTNDKTPPVGPMISTHIGSHSIIGAGALILPGITICSYAKVGAGAIVTKNIEIASEWYFGNPARRQHAER